MIAITPFLFKFYDYLPKEENSEYSILGITIGSNGFDSVSTYVWFMMGKIIPLYLLILWFLTSKDWWYHILIIPIAMYSFQIFEEWFSSDSNHVVVDSKNILWLLPVCMVVIPFVYFIRVKLYDKYVHGIDLEAIEQELNQLKTDTSENKEEEALKKNDGFENQEPLLKERTLKLSTNKIEQILKQLQTRLQSLLHIR
ncbi:hypothetical protein [Maribacter sp. MMG018]|uniref:hypothetical protein n=1 Tax=Maribacter sp. MMG018 TaxID=2822688 RepID=UPI001FFD480A|nr:hypothetical protein [Maribacter sp. MMG018]